MVDFGLCLPARFLHPESAKRRKEALPIDRPRWTVTSAPIVKRVMSVAQPRKGEGLVRARGGDLILKMRQAPQDERLKAFADIFEVSRAPCPTASAPKRRGGAGARSLSDTKAWWRGQPCVSHLVRSEIRLAERRALRTGGQAIGSDTTGRLSHLGCCRAGREQSLGILTCSAQRME